MSSILDALKKLEAESVEEEPGRAPRGGENGSRPRSAPAGSPRGGGRSVLYFALGFLAAACVILSIFLRPAPEAPKKSAPAPRTPAPKMEIPPPTGPAKRGAPSRTTDSPGPSETAARAPAPPASPSPAAPRKKRPAKTDAPLSKPATVPDRTPRAIPRPVVEPLAPVSELKLQAIAWSEDPGRRIAVIDGRIIHEGDSLGGRTVDSIGKDKVVLRAEEKSWTLAFRREEKEGKGEGEGE